MLSESFVNQYKYNKYFTDPYVSVLKKRLTLLKEEYA